MLAQLSSKDKQTFLNIKPTVIDKLISKNKSSIQNSLLYTHEDSDGSVSEDSEESSSSSRESNLVIPVVRPAVIMAPVKKKEKVGVLDQKLPSRSQPTLKRGRGRPPNQAIKGASNLKVMAAKKLLEHSKRGAPKKIVRDLRPTGKVKRDTVETPSPRSVKPARTSMKRENLPSTAGNRSIDNSVKPLVTKRKRKNITNLHPIDGNDVSPLRSTLDPPTNTVVLLTSRSSPRKFPNNIMDRWKSTGFVIRGRGRGRGRGKGTSPGSFRGGLRRGTMRSERYNTRDSQTGLMRSGKKRKCSDSNLVEGLERVRRKRITVNQIKREKIDCPSDEQSSFVTTSELSFCENENSLKQSDEETVNLRSAKVKVEIEDTEDETTHSRDTNSNVFLGRKRLEKHAGRSCRYSDTIDQSDSSTILKQNVVKLGTRRFGRGRKRLVLLGKATVSQSDSSVKDSDCSVDSDFTTDDATNSPKSAKRQRRKGVDGIWVRRSTRSIGKTVKKAEPDTVAVEELFKDKGLSVDLDSNSKSSFNVDDINLVDADSTVKDISKLNDESIAVIETPIKDNKNLRFVDDCTETDVKNISSPDLDKPHTPSSTDEEINTSIQESDSTNDFSLVLEETPLKTPATKAIKSVTPRTLLFNISPIEKNAPTSITTYNGQQLVDANSSAVNNEVQEPYSKQDNSSICDLELVKTTQDDQSLRMSNNANNNITCSEGQQIVQSELEKTNEMLCDASKDKAIDTGFGTFGEKIVESINDESVLMSDEKILSMIDSFCQSDSNTDLSIDDGSQETADGDNSSKEMGLDSLSKTTDSMSSLKSVEQNGKESQTNDIFTEKPNINAPLDNELEHSEIDTKLDLKTIGKEEPTDSSLVINEERIPCLDDIQSQHIDPSSECKGLKIESSYDDNVKMDIDLESTDKAPESSEESSSDSNSNMSELMSTALETDAVNRAKDEEAQCRRIEENQSETSLSEENRQMVSNEPEASTSSQSGSFSFLRTDSSNKEMCNEDTSLQRKLLRKSSTEESTEERPSKELLSALGLQSLHSVAEEKPKRPNESYTGTLKAVIKLNRSSDKKGRKSFFKQGDKLAEDAGGGGDRLEYRICGAEELLTEGVPLTHLSDIPANRKAQMKVNSQFDLSNSPNIVGASGSMETPSTAEVTKEAGCKQNLVIPEKSSSFSIHPERLCTDVCSYCFGKFGSLDTPCHLAQLKNSERQAKILAIEVHLSTNSCLCDGCFRYVDRKANCPASQRSRKPAARRGPLAGTICAVQDCSQPARHSVRRKWLIKLKKSIGKKLVIDMDKNPHLPFPLCSQHYYWVDYFTVCGICKKRLTRNHMYALGPEADELNQALSDDGIPVRLSDKLFLCKLCRYYSSLRLKYRDPASMSSTHRLFLNSYRKKILQYHDIPVSDSEEEGKSIEEENGASEPQKPKKKRSKTKSLDGNESKKRNLDKEEKSDPGNEDRSNDSQMIDYSYLDTLNVHREEPTATTVDYSALGDFDGQVGFSNIASFLNPLEGAQGTVYPSDAQNRPRAEKPTRIQVKFGNLNIGKLSNLNIGQDTRPSSSASTAPERPPYLPGERELNLAGEFEFHGTPNPSSGWERCTSTIQFDRDTKKLWQELQRPYGNQSSFLRHLVILEKHWRNGSLVLSENPNPRTVKYINSVRNRVQAYDGALSSETVVEKLSKPEVAVTLPPPPRPMSTPIRTTTAPPPLMKIAPGTTPWLSDQLRRPPPYYSVSTHSRLVPVTAPPPYRFPSSGPRTIRLPAPSPTYSVNSRGQQNIRPVSISYQQFKKIRLEQPSISASHVTVSTPKLETPSTLTNSSLAKDFAPLICDVRSLATTTTSADWNESFRQQQQKMLKQNIAKYYAPILPKIPNSLTVTTFPQTTALVMKTSSLTIEKAPSDSSSKPTIAPPEKPSISVFRETTPSENG